MAEGPEERPPIHGVLQCPETFADFCLDNFKRIREGYEGLLLRLSAIETQFALLKVADESVAARLNGIESAQSDVATRLNGIESDVRSTRTVILVFAWVVGTAIALAGVLVAIRQLA